MRMRAAAKLKRGARLDDANHLAVLFAGHPNRAGLLRLVERKHARNEVRIVTDHLVDAMRDRALLLRSQRPARPPEVEPHAIDSDPGTGLIDLFAENVFERSLQEMRRRVMA